MARVTPAAYVHDEEAVRDTAEESAVDERGATLSEVWDEFEASKKFFSSIHLAKDGGFSDVKTLFLPDRFFWASFQLVCVVLNLYFIIVPNVDTLLDEYGQLTVPVTNSSRHLILNAIIGLFLAGESRLEPKVLLACLELGMLVFHICRAIVVCIRMLMGDHVTRWHGAATILWDIIPEMAAFSAMKSLYFVTPKIFIPALSQQVQRAVMRRGSKFGLPIIGFLALRVFYAFVGFEAFMIKFHIAAAGCNTATSFLSSSLIAAAFLNQLLGVIDVNKFAHKRLFTFIFGGEDSFLSEREEKKANTWRAMLARRMWIESRSRMPSVAWFLAVALAYGDSDFQQLTLNESTAKQALQSGHEDESLDEDLKNKAMLEKP